MIDKIFVNIPVADLPRSMEFYKQVGFTFNPQFTSDATACMVISEHIYSMLLTHEKFKSFTPRQIADPKQTSGTLIALSCGSRAEVDDLTRKAIAAGGSKYDEPTDHGFMYEHGFEDLDGNMWGTFWMDPNFVPPQ